MNPIRSILSSLILCFSLSAVAQSPQLVKLWETDSTFKVPESVFYSEEGNILYVSNIDGKPDEKDLKGSISKLSLDGKKVTHYWAVNLSAPKGLGLYKNQLFVADLDEVVAIDIKSGKVSQRIPVEGAIFLNDLAIDQKGTIYVSDSRTGKIHRIQDGKVDTFLEGQINVNGLLVEGDHLLFVVKGALWKSDQSKVLIKVASGMDESTDGIVRLVNNNLVVSCWNGIIYSVKADGTTKELVDTRAQKSNTADIGYNPAQNIVYVPTFFKNKVVAYQVK